MNATEIRHVVIVGGDLAGWTTAAALVNAFAGTGLGITVVSLPDLINAEPVQYTAPSSLKYFEHNNIDLLELVRQTGATFRLGTGLHNLTSANTHRICPFGEFGARIGFIPFHHYVSRANQSGQSLNLNDFSANAVAARNARFAMPGKDQPPLEFGLNMNTEKLTRLLRSNAKVNGVAEIRAGLTRSIVDESTGLISELTLDNGNSVVADLFIDCSGEEALLVGRSLGTAFTSWQQYLACERIIGTTARVPDNDTPVHHCHTSDNGWLLSTPLQHRAAYQFLYSPALVSDDEATQELLTCAGDSAEAVSINTSISGYRETPWSGNCIALGPAAAHVESLELSSFHLLQESVLHMIRLWPTQRLQPALANEFNVAHVARYKNLRDFTLVRYLGNTWRTSPFWAQVETQQLPASLRRRLSLFRSRGRLMREEHEIYSGAKWASAFSAAGIVPSGYDPLLDNLDDAQLKQHFAAMQAAIAQAVTGMPLHRAFLKSL